MIQVTDKSLDPQVASTMVRKNTNGAVITFLGTTRGNSDNRRVLYLEYEAYIPMAVNMLTQIKESVKTDWDIDDIVIMHRIGRLEIEEISLIVAVASPHRKEAFEACISIVNQIKETVPIWKKEVFEDGEEWVGCHSQPQIESEAGQI